MSLAMLFCQEKDLHTYHRKGLEMVAKYEKSYYYIYMIQ